MLVVGLEAECELAPSLEHQVKRPWPSRSLAFGAPSHQPERNDDDDRTEPCANFRTPKEIALIPAHHVKSSPKEHENDYREATSDRGECNAIECVSN